MHVYRYRSPGLLSQKGLLYDEWYFASKDELNDPIDMQSKFEFPDDSDETWHRMTSTIWENTEQAKTISTYFARLGPVPYEQLLKSFDEHKNKIIRTTFKDKSITMEEFIAFRDKLDKLHSLLVQYAPSSGYSVSLSKSHTDMVMWSHYASSHQGYSLIYRPIEGRLHQCPNRKKESLIVSRAHTSVVATGFEVKDIHYEDQLDAINAFTLLPGYYTGYEEFPEPDRLNYHSNVQGQLLTKNKCWEYEQECRLLLPQPKKYISGVSDYNSLQRLFHYDFSQVVGIIFGARMSEHEKKTIREIVNHKLDNHYSNLGASQNKTYAFDFLFQEADICTYSRAVKIIDQELVHMGTTHEPGTEFYERQLAKWRKFEGITIESGSYKNIPIP